MHCPTLSLALLIPKLATAGPSPTRQQILGEVSDRILVSKELKKIRKWAHPRPADRVSGFLRHSTGASETTAQLGPSVYSVATYLPKVWKPVESSPPSENVRTCSLQPESCMGQREHLKSFRSRSLNPAWDRKPNRQVPSTRNIALVSSWTSR